MIKDTQLTAGLQDKLTAQVVEVHMGDEMHSRGSDWLSRQPGQNHEWPVPGGEDTQMNAREELCLINFHVSYKLSTYFPSKQQ